MKTHNKLYVATILVALLLVLLVLGHQRYKEPITLSVPACGIEVECEEVFTLRSARHAPMLEKKIKVINHQIADLEHNTNNQKRMCPNRARKGANHENFQQAV